MQPNLKHKLFLNIVKSSAVLFFVFIVFYNHIFVSQFSLSLKEVKSTSPTPSLPQNASQNVQNTTKPTSPTSGIPPPGYLVWNQHCRIPDIDPFTPDAMKIFKKKNYSECRNERPLIKIIFDLNRRTYNLHIDENVRQKLSDPNITCCYQSIIRSGSGKRIDKDFKLQKCVQFHDGDVIPNSIDSLIVSCDATKTKKNIQKDAFFLVEEKPEVNQRLNFFRNKSNSKNRPVSVLMLGIDSVSKFNLRRTMPELSKRLEGDNWFELKGYNKMDDNTFPNLMAMLTGYNKSLSCSKCNPKSANGLSNCPMIWNLFRDNGYVTGYAEDETWMSTFNFNKLGFNKTPVDYYHRPFMLAIEKNLKIKKQSSMSFCVGARHSAEYIYDFAIKFATRYKSEPYFGLFWTNTFSHNSFNDPASMDTRIVKYIDELSSSGILDESIVILFSDHGMRFGPLRSLRQGFLEERLPFIFIWLPYWFRGKYPEFVEALALNKYRLTNAYDLHMTLKHILELTGRTSKLPQATSCANCQSLLLPVPEQRSCQEIAIDEHWCTCIPYEDVSKKDNVVKGGINAILMHLNEYLERGKFFPRCTKLKLKSIDSARKRYDFDESLMEANSSRKLEHYRIKFSAEKGTFEASVTYSKRLKVYEIVDSVSRLDAYKDVSQCVDNAEAKKYCICDKKNKTKKN